MNNVDFRHIANARMSSRVRQVLVLVAAILIGMLISVSVNSQPLQAKHIKNTEPLVLTPQYLNVGQQ